MRILVYISLFISSIGWGQNAVGYLFEELPNDSIENQAIDVHTSLKPAVRQSAQLLQLTDTKTSNWSIVPLIDANGIYSDSLGYRTGAGFQAEANLNKFYIRTSAVGGYGALAGNLSTNAFYSERKGNNYTYADIRGRIAYTHNKFFNFQAGLDNNFIGEGNRSLFLSDYGVPHPFGLIRTRFWRVEYAVLYQFMREKLPNGWYSKYGATHHFSLNLAKWLNVGVFESVIFQPRDTLLNRGFDAEYLNPVIFYRPQEYSIGSADNVILGMDLAAKYKGHTLYGQLVLDEFNLTELRAKTGWWANKFGVQTGIKGRFKLLNSNAFYRVEYNGIRPYTFAHINSLQNYANQGMTLNHPYGANFHELLVEFKYQKDNYLIKLFGSYILKGLDKDGFSYGGNIYQPYFLRPYEYGHHIGQGTGINAAKCILTLDYTIKSSLRLHVFLENHLNYSTLANQLNYVPVVGIRSQLWNDYRNF